MNVDDLKSQSEELLLVKARKKREMEENKLFIGLIDSALSVIEGEIERIESIGEE